MTTYHSQTEISINVCVNGVKRHLRFTPTTLGESHFSTDDPDLRRVIERHPQFGRLFQRQAQPAAPVTPSKTVDNTPTVQTIHIPFTDIAEAKEVLAERLGVSRTSLRTLPDILQLAEKHHIIFDGLPAT